jgi:RNA polymerase sigma-70 factor (ECF subfamily)
MLDRVTAMMSPDSAGSHSGSPVDQVMAAENQETVRRALSSLSDVDRQILLLKYTEGWSYRQLADHLGVREDTVEYRLLKARKNLRKQLAAFAEDHV